MYTNSFIKEQMACDEAAIKPDLTNVVSRMEPCPKYDSLKDALNELASLLPDKNLMNVMSSTSAISSLKPLSVNVPASAPESVNAPQNAAVPDVNPAPAATIDDSEVIAYNGGKLRTTYGKIKQMLENTILKQTNEERKNKIQGLLDKIKEAKEQVEVQNLMNLFGSFNIIGNKSPSQYYEIGINGGTRKRRMRRVKTQRRRKNARTIKKKKITNNKSGKRN